MPAGSCPAHFDIRPSDVALVSSADVIISLGWEPWLDSLLESSGNTDCVVIECLGLGAWNTPTGAFSYIERIADGLEDAFPELNETIEANKVTYIEEINATAQELKQLFESKGFVGRKVVCMEWQRPFVEWLGLNVTLAYKPPEGLSASDIINISKALQDNSICAIIDNLQSGTEFGSKRAAEAGVSHIVLTNFPGALPNTDTYVDMLKYNTNQTIQGISLFDFKQGEIKELEETIKGLEVERNVFITLSVVLGIAAVVLGFMYRRK